MRKKVSLVLGSGGARGLTQIGVIQAIESQGFEIDEVIGCSIGSLIGGMYAHGQLAVFADWLLKLNRREVFRLMDFTWQSSGMMKGNRVIAELKKLIPDVNIEELPILFKAVATNLAQEKDVLIAQGSLYAAIRSSISIPGVFTAIRQADQLYVDGGVLNPLPLCHVSKATENLVFAVNLEASPLVQYNNLEAKATKIPSSLHVLLQAYYAMRGQLANQSLQLYQPDYVIQVPRDLVGMWEYEKASFLIEKGRELTLKALERVH